MLVVLLVFLPVLSVLRLWMLILLIGPTELKRFLDCQGIIEILLLHNSLSHWLIRQLRIIHSWLVSHGLRHVVSLGHLHVSSNHRGVLSLRLILRISTAMSIINVLPTIVRRYLGWWRYHLSRAHDWQRSLCRSRSILSHLMKSLHLFVRFVPRVVKVAFFSTFAAGFRAFALIRLKFAFEVIHRAIAFLEKLGPFLLDFRITKIWNIFLNLLWQFVPIF